MKMLDVGNQKELVFFGRYENGPTAAERASIVSPKNSACPLNGCGPERLIRLLRRIAFDALARRNHCNPFAYILLADAEVARQVARSYSATLGLPYVGCTAKRIREANDVLLRIAQVCEMTTFVNGDFVGTLELVPVMQPSDPNRFGGKSFFVIPPCVVLIRHVDQLQADVLHRLRIASSSHGPVLHAAEWPADTSRVSWLFHCDHEQDVPDELDHVQVLGGRRR